MNDTGSTSKPAQGSPQRIDDDARVLRLWVRPEPKVPPVEVDAIELLADEGIVGDHTRNRMRHVTFLCEGDWDAAAAEIGHPSGAIDPVGRRANVLLSGLGAGKLLRRTVAIGSATIQIRGVTAPFPTMDRAANGMKEALKPAVRSGVWGRVLTGGIVRRGDPLVILQEPEVRGVG